MEDPRLAGLTVYLVGGAVRDRLLGLEPKDRDYVVVGATPDLLIARGFKPVGKDFPVFLHPESGEEYALARTERKTGRGYHGFAFDAAPEVTLEEDLKRRDLTMNAMAQAPDGSIIDPFGGQADLREGLLRHVSPAFAEDPVRILRVARYAARYGKWGFRVSHATNALMRGMVEAGEVDALVAERVWKELAGALGEERPERFVEVLRGCGALAVLLPELERLFGVPQPKHYHPEEDTGVHVLMVLAQAARLTPDPRVRFAALVHDLGKGSTPREEWPKHHGHEERGVELVKGVCERLHAPVEYRDLALLVARHHGLYHRADELRAATFIDTFERLDAFRRPERLELFLLACEADARGRPGYEDLERPEGPRFRRALAAARGVAPAPLLERGLRGAELGEALRQERIAAVKRALE